MSGRSAYVRAKINTDADKKAQRQHTDFAPDNHYAYGYPTLPSSPLSRPNLSAEPSFASSSSHRPRRRQSVSSSGSTYGFPGPLRKPRPIIVASAIEKSDFRTHLDGMSNSLRGKLGSLFKGGDNDKFTRWRPGTAAGSSDSDSRSTGFTPSVNAVPSLTMSTSPSEVPSAFPSIASAPTPAPRSKSQQESVIHKVRRFEGGGKLPQLGWKSLSNVRFYACSFVRPC